MKMSFFWMVMLSFNIVSIISDIIKGDYSFWIYLSVVSAALSIWLYWGALKRERREVEATKKFINIVINHMNNEPADVTAKRVSDHLNML